MGADSWASCRCEIRLYRCGLDWEEPVLDGRGGRAGAGHFSGDHLARETRVHHGAGWRLGPATFPGAPASGWVRLGPEGLGIFLPSPFSPIEADNRLGESWVGLIWVPLQLYDWGRRSPSICSCPTQSSQYIPDGMGNPVLALCAALLLPWYWAVPGLWASTPLPARMLYWSEAGNQPRLMEATMDGRRQRVLRAQGLGWPTALALDLPTSRLFWLDEKLGSVGSTHLDGTDVKVCSWGFWLWGWVGCWY